MLATYGLNIAYACAVLAVTTVGLGIVFGLLGILNMAHGEFVMLGAYSAVATQQAGLPAWVAVPLAILVTGIVGWIVERVLIRPLYSRPFDTLLATWGVAIVLREAVAATFGRGYQDVHGVADMTLGILGLQYPAYRLLVIAIVIVAFGIATIWYRRTLTGAAIRGLTMNPALAQSMGLNTTKISAIAFITGVVLAGISGVLLAPVVRIDPYMGLDYLLNSFFVLVIGGLGTLLGLGVGTSIIGGTQTVVSGLIDQTFGYGAVLIVSVFFLWSRPNGLVARS
ncbi:branched-chain amino acid ABC transporter permease [Paraburkholderia bannensis]|uniref:branched-chain amino acid ABC transporter permease n=1 Tax=Paraburkholderia bannensis TaxID=765414 RepID=UPI002AB7C3FB|nr:branched-chain amino acid ABC transporter permease [Paraburkholderia bannensis]